MTQSYQQIKNISEEYNSLFSKNEFYPLQKAYSTPHFIVLVVRFPGKTLGIYIGRGNQYSGILLSHKLPPSYLRVQDRLLDYVRKHLVGVRLGYLEVDQVYRLVHFKFKNESSDNEISFGYKDRQLFFCKKAKDEIYLSWINESILKNNFKEALISLGPDKTAGSDEFKLDIDSYLKTEEKKLHGQPIQRKKEKFLLKKLKNIQADLEKVKLWRLIQHELKEDQLNLDSRELQIHGYLFKFNSQQTVWEKKDQVFNKIKKLKKAEEILSTRLAESNQELEKVKKGEFDFDLTKEKAIQPLWATGAKSKGRQNAEFNIRHFKIQNLSGVIGLDARSNDHIRTLAAKEHYWFHIEKYPGSHCIVKTDQFGQLNIEVLNAIASMLRDMSRLSILEIPMLYSQIKYVKGLKGSKGEVLIKKPRYLSCTYLEWKEIITIL